jgi:hypothetical protein
MKIEELEPQFAQRLGDPLKHILHDLNYVFPEYCQVRVSLLDANRRKKKSNASANNWSPESGRIEIRFEPVPQEQKALQVEKSERADNRSPVPALQRVRDAAAPNSNPESAESELLRALDRAESTPGWNFVPLKKFRNEILPLAPIASTLTDIERKDTLDLAIKKQLILISKVPNPKAPQFPVTTIRLNRLMPGVKAALGQPGDSEPEFRPIVIRGEPLSSTILRERR